jgi:hypothetical protein
MLHAQQRAQHVGVEGVRVALSGLLSYRPGLAFGTRSVDGHVQATKSLDSSVNQASHILFVAHVGADVFSLHAERTQFSGQGIANVVSPPADNYVSALSRKSYGCGAPDTRESAGDENNFVFHWKFIFLV